MAEQVQLHPLLVVSASEFFLASACLVQDISTTLFLSSSFPLAAYTDWLTWHLSAFPINSVHLLPSHPHASLRKESRISKAAATKTQPGLTSNSIKVLSQWGGSFGEFSLCLFKTSLLSWLQTRVWVRRSENSERRADNVNSPLKSLQPCGWKNREAGILVSNKAKSHLQKAGLS